MHSGDIDREIFLEKLGAQFQQLEPGSLAMGTEFRQLPEWSSMQSLVVIASFDWEYGVTLSAEELVASRTIEDLYLAVMAKRSLANGGV